MTVEIPAPGAGRVSSTQEVVAAALRPAGRVDLVGAAGGAAGAVVARLAAAAAGRLVVAVTPDEEGSRRLAADLRYFASELPRATRPEVLRYPEHDLPPCSPLRPDRRNVVARLGALSRLARRGPAARAALLLSAPSLTRLVIPRGTFEAAARRLEEADEVDRDELVADLVAAGYRRTPVVEDRGTLAVRGALVDVFPPAAAEPLRIELEGDLVARIRTFDPETQLTTGSRQVAELDAASEAIRAAEEVAAALDRMRAACDEVDLPSTRTRELLEAVETGSTLVPDEAWLPAFHDGLEPLWAYFGDDPVFFVEEPEAVVDAWSRQAEAAAAAREEALGRGEPSLPPATLLAEAAAARAEVDRHRLLLSHGLGVEGPDPWALQGERRHDLGARSNDALDAALREAARGRADPLGPLVRHLLRLTEEEACGVRIVARSVGQAERLLSMLRSHELAVELRPEGSPDPAPAGSIQVVVGDLERGFHLPGEGAAWIAEQEILGVPRRRRRRRASTAGAFEDLAALEEGARVVHVDHGIGRYLGLVRREVDGLELEFLLIEYLGGDRLYLPVYRLNQIHRYVGGESIKLDRLGGQTFARRKKKARRSVEELADQLLQVQAARQALPGVSCGPADSMFVQLEATFPWDETPEQQRAIDEVLADLESGQVMDRLVCGDVGFGKTEVAVRAAFRTALAGRQVAVLVPTTVLAQQHAMTFAERLGAFPVVTEVLSRFRSAAEQTDVLRRLKAGAVDIVVGTHRLLSKDVHFKDLGLLVIDEEHRFGVEHKERIKKLRIQVDVLTLSATPIPRTLQMSLSSLRDLSLITTPPEGRRPIRTYVTRADDRAIADAIRREVARGGQVFYVRNRVKGLRERASHLESLVPEARFAVGHGQMPEARLEEVMLEFVAGRVDVLVCTTIIESGLDVPRANTVIVERADRFGLAQLYHVRGRVGRSTERAYAYLLVPPASEMTDDGKRRIAALQRLSELGSGFALATMDLEIRGAGELLGVEQSGHVADVGYQMYVELLEEAVAELKGEPPRQEVDPELSFDVPGFIPEDHVPDTGQRLVLYQRLAGAEDADGVREVAAEMRDRFGPAPPPLEDLFRMMEVKAAARRLGALGVEGSRKQVTLHLSDQTSLEPAKILALVSEPRSPYRMTPDMRLTRRLQDGELGDGVAAAAATVADLLALLPEEGVSPGTSDFRSRTGRRS